MSTEELVTAVLPLPDAVPMAAPRTFFWILLMATFFLHLVPMNLVVGGSILASIYRFLGRKNRKSERKLAVWIYKVLPVSVAAAITFGVASLLFVQVLYGRLFYVSSLLMGWFWLGVIPLLILAYYSTYLIAFRGEQLGVRAVALGVGSAALFVFIGFIYSNNMSLMLRPDKFLPRYLIDGRGLWLNLSDPTLIPRFAHMMGGAVAVAGLAVALVGLSKVRSEPNFASWVIQRGSVWYVLATAVNFIVGTWFLLSFDRTLLVSFLRTRPVGVGGLLAAIVLGLLSLSVVAAGLQSSRQRVFVVAGAALLVPTLLSMILVRDEMRSVAVEATLEPITWTFSQWGAIGLFVAILFCCLFIVIWMLKRLRCEKSDQ